MAVAGKRTGVALLLVTLVSAPAVAAEGSDYLRDVKPIFKVHCVRCHGPLKSEAGLRLDTRALALKGGENGAALAPGQAATSLLLKRVLAKLEHLNPGCSVVLDSAEPKSVTAPGFSSRRKLQRKSQSSGALPLGGSSTPV